MVLAQEKVEEKSNETTPIPKLVDHLDIQGAVVTIGAMGCQKSIAQHIVESVGGHILAVKGNQNTLYSEISQHFNHLFDIEHNRLVNVSIQEEKSRGRLECRKCLSTEDLRWLSVKEQWRGIHQSVAVVESKRTVDEVLTTERRYYMSSLKHNSESLNKTIRAHWEVEKSLHGIMDVVFW